MAAVWTLDDANEHAMTKPGQKHRTEHITQRFELMSGLSQWQLLVSRSGGCAEEPSESRQSPHAIILGWLHNQPLLECHAAAKEAEKGSGVLNFTRQERCQQQNHSVCQNKPHLRRSQLSNQCQRSHQVPPVRLRAEMEPKGKERLQGAMGRGSQLVL